MDGIGALTVYDIAQRLGAYFLKVEVLLTGGDACITDAHVLPKSLRNPSGDGESLP